MTDEKATQESPPTNSTTMPVESSPCGTEDGIFSFPPMLVINDDNREKLFERFPVLQRLDALLDLFDPVSDHETGKTIWQLLRSVHREIRNKTFSGELYPVDKDFVDTFIAGLAEGHYIPYEYVPCVTSNPFWIPKPVLDMFFRAKREQRECEVKRQANEVASLREAMTSVQRELAELKENAMICQTKGEQHELESKKQADEVATLREAMTSVQTELAELKVNATICQTKIKHHELKRKKQDEEVATLRGTAGSVQTELAELKENAIICQTKGEQHELESKKQAEEVATLKGTVGSVQTELAKLKEEAMTVPDLEHCITVKANAAGVLDPNGFVAPDNGWIFIRGTCACKGLPAVDVYVNGKQVGTFNDWTGKWVHMPFTWPLRKGDVLKVTGGEWHYVLFFPCMH